MRFVPVLVLCAHVAVVNSAAAQPAKTQRLDVNGDSLPDGAIIRLGTTRFQAQDTRAISLSPDGTTVAVVAHAYKAATKSWSLEIDFMDTSTGKSARRPDLAEAASEKMQFTPDGKGLVFSNWSGIKLVDLASGKVTTSIDTDGHRDSNVALSSDGKWVATQPQKYVYHAPVGIWETKTGKEVISLPGKGAACKALAFSPDAKRLLLWSMIPSHADGKSMGFDADCKAALACIDISTCKIVGETTIGSAHHVALCPDGETVAFEAADHKSVHVRHLPSRSERCIIPVKDSRFAFAPDGKVLFTIDESGRGALWDAAKGDKIRDLEGALSNKDFSIAGISKDGRTIAVLDGGWHSAPLVVVWNAATGKRIGRPAGHDGTVTCIGYAPGGKLLASGSIDKTVRLWNPATGEHLRVLAVHTEAITAIAISPDGKLLASSSQSGVTRLSNIADGKVVADFVGPDKGAHVLAFSSEGEVLFAGGNSPEVLAWQIASAKEIVRLKTGDDGAVMALGDGGALALTANGEIRAEETPERLQVWNPKNKQPLASITIRDEQGGSVRCEAAIFSREGRLLASSQISEYQGIRPYYGAAQLRLWERASSQPILTLAAAATKKLAFSPNGRFLAAGSVGRSGHLFYGDGSSIDIWDIVTGKKAGTLPVSPRCVAFSPDGMHLATGGWDHNVLIWEAPIIKLPKVVAKAPSAAECDAWWTALGGDAAHAYKVIGQMIEVPEHTLALLKERVRPIKSSTPDAVAKLIVQLESETFSEREEAENALDKMGESVAPLLVKALEGKLELESRRRLAELLGRCEATSNRSLQNLRAVAVLEWIGTPAAKVLLRTLSEGDPRARLTIEARAALKRLSD